MTVVERLIGLMPNGVTVSEILIVCNVSYLSVKTEIRNQQLYRKQTVSYLQTQKFQYFTIVLGAQCDSGGLA